MRMELDKVVVYAFWTLYLPTRLLACIRVPYLSPMLPSPPMMRGYPNRCVNPTNAGPLPRYCMLHAKRQHTPNSKSIPNRLTNQLTQLLRREIEQLIVEALLGHLPPFANHPRRSLLHVSCDVLEFRIADRVILERTSRMRQTNPCLWKRVRLEISVVVQILGAEPCE